MTDIRDDADDLDLIAGDDHDDEQGGDDAGQATAVAEDEDVLVLGEEEVTAPEPETDLIKHLRQQIRERDKRLSAVQRQPQVEDAIVVGDRPRLADFDYDEEALDRAMDEWEQRKETKRQQDQRRDASEREQQGRWQQVQESYAAKKAALPFADKDDVERAAFEALSDVQQAVIAKVADNPALVIYATKNQARLAALAAIDDPLKLAREIGKMEATMTIKKRARAPEPDTAIRGNTVNMSGSDKKLEALEREAAKTRDRTEVAAYKRSLRAK